MEDISSSDRSLSLPATQSLLATSTSVRSTPGSPTTSCPSSRLEFLGSSEEDGSLPPLFVAPQHEEAASCIIDYLHGKSGASKKIKLFSLPKLILEMYNLPLDPADVEGRMTVHVATSVLETDKFSHYAGIGCQFHEALENPIHCSEAIVRRHVFDLVDACCRLYQLVLR